MHLAVMDLPMRRGPRQRRRRRVTRRPSRCPGAHLENVRSLQAEVYHRAMGLFRSKARKNREKAAAEFLKEQARTAKAQAGVARRGLTTEARPNPDQPGWGQIIGQEIGKAREDRASQ